MKQLSLLLTAFALIGVSCASKTGSSAGGGLFSFLSSDGFKLRPTKEVVLDNGLKILFIKDDSLPRVGIITLVKVGVREEPAKSDGLNALTAELLDQGTARRGALEIADQLATLGSDLSVRAGVDVTTISGDTLVTTADQFLELYAEVLMNPAFKETEVQRTKDQVLAAIKKRVDSPSSYAEDQYESFLFGAHPYAKDVNGTTDSVKSLRKADIVKHYLTWYRPNNTSIAVVGRFDGIFEKRVQDTFKGWAKRSVKTVAVQAPPQVDGFQVKLVTKPALEQTQIRFGRIGIARNDKDYLPLRLGNEVLGGSFASRLNQKVRDDLGLTYSIYSSFDSRKEPGLFTISTFTKNESVGRTIDETLKVYRETVEKGVTAQELEAAKAQLIGQFPRAVETADGLALNMLMLDYYGVPLSYLTDFQKNVRKVSIAEVNDAIRSHLDAGKLKILIYGDEKVIGAQLKDLQPVVEKAK